MSKKHWLTTRYGKQQERKGSFESLSGLKYDPLIVGEDLDSFDESRQLGLPGEYPFTRGIQPSMYRGRLWTMRQFAGFGSPEDTNRRFHYLIGQGTTGLSTAFDMPTLMGHDADGELSLGEVGREGVSVSTIEDMERLFAGIDLSQVTTSMTINCSAAPVLAMYFAMARRKKIDLNLLGGTIQNDILKEYIAQKEWICPPAPGVKLTCDVIEFCANHAKRFNPVSISGYHIREAGSTAVQELAFTIADGIAYVEHCINRGMGVDSFAPRLSFFFDVHNDFFEEIAKLRAARRIWARLMKERFNSNTEASQKLRTHAQTAGVSLTAQQPLNNVARVALQALAAVLGGTQSLHTNSLDETLALPTEEAVTVALRTQQIIAEETGVADVVDPLGGSYFIEDLTNRIEAAALMYIQKIDELGGMLKAVELGFPQAEIAEAAYLYQQQLERGERKIVGVNCFTDGNKKVSVPTLKISHEVERDQVERLKAFRLRRNNEEVLKHVSVLRECCRSNQNVMSVLIEGVDNGLTLGECCTVFREVFGVYRDPGVV